MSYTYTRTAREDVLLRTDESGVESWIPCERGNRAYEEFLASGVEAGEYIPPVLSEEAKTAMKLAAYQNESDPLYFLWQAGESTKEAWEAKRAEIAQRFA